MSNVRCINYWDLCRICTASSEQKINIYSPDGRAKNLSQKIAECLPVQIDEKDGLPKVVCAQCAQQVEQMYEMRNISKNSQTILRNWLNHRTLQTDDKVFIKDAINDAGKSLTVVGTAPSAGLVSASTNNQTNDLLSSIMQAVGMQVQQQPSQVQQQQQQYTITLDSHVPSQPIHAPAPPPEIKSEKQNTLEEFIRLKPDIKITPLGKKDNLNNNTSSTSSLSSIKQPQQLPTQTLSAIPTPTATQIQLQPQQLNELNVFLQQQSLLQQLQQLQAQTQYTNATEDIMGATDKKPKLNFVLSSPSTTPQFAGLQQLAGIGGTQPQIQLQLLPSGGAGGSVSNAAGGQQPQQFNAAALLSSLTGSQVVGGTGAANMLSPNKCFLPITIRDENSDQQIVAHIDTKNLVLPTTYQVQMKLQPQLATADGQPIMQLTPTSIPATLQLTPQTLGNATSFQTATTTQQNQFLLSQPQQQSQQQQQQQQLQVQQAQQQQAQQLPPNTAQVTSQQIIRSPRTNPQLVIRNVSSESSNQTNSNADASLKFKTPAPRQQSQQQQQLKYKTTQPSVASIAAVPAPAAVTPAVSNANNVANTRVAVMKPQPTPVPNNVAALQRLSSNTTITKLTKSPQAVANTKMPLLNKQNITISRISAQAAPKPEHKTVPAPIPAPVKTEHPAANALSVQQQHSQQQPQMPQPLPNIAYQRKVNRKPPEQPPQPKSKTVRPQQQILPVPAQQTTTSTARQQQPQQKQQQQQVASSAEATVATAASSLTCPTCQREFKKKEHLTQHVKLHAGLRPFKCSEEGCDKAFSRKEHLSRHLVSHSGQKMFTCEDCKKPFSRKDNLNKHKRTHSIQPGETKLHSCEFCNKNFASKQHYEKHREMHKKSRLESGGTAAQPSSGVPQAGKAQLFESKSAASVTATASAAAAVATPQGPQTQAQSAQSQVQQPQIMHVDLDGSTITITQASDSNMQTSLANFVQLGFSQFQNASGSTNQLVCKLEK